MWVHDFRWKSWHATDAKRIADAKRIDDATQSPPKKKAKTEKEKKEKSVSKKKPKDKKGVQLYLEVHTSAGWGRRIVSSSCKYIGRGGGENT